MAVHALPTAGVFGKQRAELPNSTVQQCADRTIASIQQAAELGDGPALTERDIVGPAIAAEDMFKYSSLNPGMGTTIRRLSRLSPRTLALMHGPSFAGDGAGALRALADDYDRRLSAAQIDAAGGRANGVQPSDVYH